MWYSLLADLIVLLHVAFVLFVLFGGLLTMKWPRAIWLHLPALSWGAIVEFTGGLCPLTPLEQWLRMRSGASGFQGDFLLRFLIPVLDIPGAPLLVPPHDWFTVRTALERAAAAHTDKAGADGAEPA